MPTSEFGDLPEWSFEDLYLAEDDPVLAHDLQTLADETESFAQDYEGKLATLNGAGWARCIKRLEAIENIETRLISFAALRFYQNTSDSTRGKFLSDTQVKLTALSSRMVFLTLEINALDETILEQAFSQNADFSRYRVFFERVRAMKPYQLSAELEKFLHDHSVVGSAAWSRLFDETMAGMSFDFNGVMLPLEAVLAKMSDQDRKAREQAARAVSDKLAGQVGLFSRITNTLIKEKEIEDRWRGLPFPAASRHLANHIEPEVVNALKEAVIAAYPDISHRYYRLKAKWLGLEKLEIWDRNAPLPLKSERVIPWNEARDIVMEAYRDFDPRMSELARPFFEKNWIDAAVTDGKSPGAFAHPCATNVHPYVMLNYLGKTRDVMTLAHELGHGVHQRLAAKQGEILARTPLTLAETASVFGEMLTFRKLLKAARDPQEYKYLLASKVEDMINTVVRQISFYDFELRVHAQGQQGELTPDQINAIWMDVSRESLGDAFNFMQGYETFWAYVPHFIHTPFYVYAYAFGDGLVNALYGIYETGFDGFEDKYFDMLSAGGSKHHRTLLTPFGLDTGDPKFWAQGLSMISRFIDELALL